jgi:hypothetical protein
MSCLWFDANTQLPADQQFCELIVEFGYVAGYIVDIRDLFEATGFEGIYNKEKDNWSIITGIIPQGFTSCRVTKWRPMKKEVDE